MQVNSTKGQLSFKAALAVIVGSIIGAGLFMKPASMALQLNSPVAMVIVWVLAGLFTLCGTLVVAELGVLMPTTGGLFIHFTHCYGKKVGFLYGWSAFSVINTASVAAVAFIAAYYLNVLIPLPTLTPEMETAWVWSIYPLGTLYPLKDLHIKLVAITMVVLLTLLNTKGVRAGGAFQWVASLINGAILLLIPAFIFSSSRGSVQHFFAATDMPLGSIHLTAWVAALTGAFFALDGWINILSIAGEIKNPTTAIPRSLFWGVSICLFLYLLMNQAYLYVLPVQAMAGSQVVAADALQIAGGAIAASFISVLIILCTLGSLNGNIMATSRITFAMGREKLFPAKFGQVDKNTDAPVAALWLHGCWISLLILSGSFDLLADMYVFVTWIAYGLAAFAVFKLRRTAPSMPRSYRVWAHPYSTGAFILFSLFYLLTTVYHDISQYRLGEKPVINSLVGLAFVIAGLPLYFYFERKNRNTERKFTHAE
jgi:APA family basic amino acid/polyamine antiporter